MSTTTKKDLIDRIAEETSQKRTAVKVMVQSFLDCIIGELSEGNRLEFRDFGVFEIRQRAPRMAQNPKTLERVPVPAKKTVKFKIGRLMPEACRFVDRESYYATLFHELVHSTGHSTRLDRGLDTDPSPFGSADYSKEEPVAEMGAAFLAAAAGISPATIEQSAAYIAG